MNDLDTAPESGRAEVSPLQLLRVLFQHKGLVLGLPIGLALIAACVVLLRPNVYTSRGTILLEVAESGTATDLLGQLSMFTGGGSQTPAGEIYLAILESERVGRAVIEDLNILDAYEITGAVEEERIQKALMLLRQKVRFLSNDRVTLTIEATDEDPERAAQIANAYIDELSSANQNMSLSRSRRTRIMVEGALAETEEELEETRARLRGFQRKHGAFALDEQTRATLGLIAELQAQLMSAETERLALSGFRRDDAAGLQNLDLRIAAISNQISGLVGDASGTEDGARIERATKPADSYLLSLAEIPDLADAYTRILMDLEVQQAKYTVLATQLEQTKVEESQSVPSFEVLDQAARPFSKSGPNRKLFVIVAFLAGLLTSVLLVVLLDDLSRRLDDDTRSELSTMIPAFLRRS